MVERERGRGGGGRGEGERERDLLVGFSRRRVAAADEIAELTVYPPRRASAASAAAILVRPAWLWRTALWMACGVAAMLPHTLPPGRPPPPLFSPHDSR
jgi:hypothetical protein